MNAAPLLPAPAELRLGYLAVDPDRLTVIATTRRSSGSCPHCGSESERVHSHYTRTLADLPWHGMAVRLVVTTRRFFCDRAGCPREIFTERLPKTAAPSARRTTRLATTLDAIGLALGGAPGGRLAAQLGMAVSGDTIRRIVLHQDGPDTSSRGPRALGVDDWAWRRNQTYGTILIDLERRCVADLLPDRSPETLATWLRRHPGVEIITRDRAGAYADGAREGAPEATQVADRFHLVCNLREAIERAVVRHAKVVHDVAATDARALPLPRTAVLRRRVSSLPHNSGDLTRDERRSAERRARRLSRYEQVMRLSQLGMSRRRIAEAIGVNRHTVATWLAGPTFPERRLRRVRARRALDPYADFVTARYDAGLDNARQLTRELRPLGYGGSYVAVRRYLLDLRRRRPRSLESEVSVRAPPRYTTNQTTWLLSRPASTYGPHDATYVERLIAACPALHEVRTLVLAFRQMFETHDASALPLWLERAKQSELAMFARGIARDRDAVVAAMLLAWSNGPVEGHVHRLKLIKRSMYGRASFALLRQRVLRAA